MNPDVKTVLNAVSADGKPEPLKSGYGVHEIGVQLNPSARCQDDACDWPGVQSKAYARTSATDHSTRTGHSVTVDTVMRTIVEVKPR